MDQDTEKIHRQNLIYKWWFRRKWFSKTQIQNTSFSVQGKIVEWSKTRNCSKRDGNSQTTH